MRIDKESLLRKGWSPKEIEDASRIIQEAEDKKHIGIKFLDKSIYWALLFLLIVGSIVCSIFLMPFIFVIQNSFILLIAAVLGFSFGVMFSILIADIERFEHGAEKRLLIALISSGVINFGLISNFAINFSLKTGLALPHDPYIIALVYLIAYISPHIVYKVVKP